MVRQALLLLLKHIIEHVKKCSLVLFFPRLVTCVMCAMTHIDNSIRLDSLKYLQLFLTDCADLLIKNAPKLPNLYLSLLTSHSNVIDVAKNITPAITNKIGNTNILTPMKTRLEIFRHISILLKTSIDCIPLDKKNDFASSVTTQVMPCFDVAKRRQIVLNHSLGHCSHFFDLSKPVPSVKLIRNWGIHPPANAFIKDCSVNNIEDERYLFSCFAAKLLPILFECWMESGPMHILSGSFDSVELDMKLVVMKLLLYIVRLAHIYSGQSGMTQLSDLCSNQFQKCFLTYFPFSNQLKSEHLFVMDLYLCEITIMLYGGVNKLSDNFATLMLNFFSHTLPLEFHLFADNPCVISECMLCFTRCLQSAVLFNDKNTALAAMLKGGTCFYNKCHIQSQAKEHLTKVFYEILVVKEKMGICERYFIF